jgi:hypothetical protein
MTANGWSLQETHMPQCIHVRVSVLEISYGECYIIVRSVNFILTSKCRVWTQGRGWKVCRGWPRVWKPQDSRRRQVLSTDRSECHTSSLRQMDSPATTQNPKPKPTHPHGSCQSTTAVDFIPKDVSQQNTHRVV